MLFRSDLLVDMVSSADSLFGSDHGRIYGDAGAPSAWGEKNKGLEISQLVFVCSSYNTSSQFPYKEYAPSGLGHYYVRDGIHKFALRRPRDLGVAQWRLRKGEKEWIRKQPASWHISRFLDGLWRISQGIGKMRDFI